MQAPRCTWAPKGVARTPVRPLDGGMADEPESPQDQEPTDADPVGEQIEPEEQEPEYAPTPFDGPYFVPVLLLGMCLWFAYDGWFNPDRLDPEASLSKYVAFNQYGAVILGVAGAALGLRAWRQQQKEGEEG